MDNYDAQASIPEHIRAMNECRDRRQSSYIEELGGWQQQLDMMFHDFDGWRAAVKAIKDRYPKPE
jgi:hypothetical protein